MGAIVPNSILAEFCMCVMAVSKSGIMRSTFMQVVPPRRGGGPGRISALFGIRLDSPLSSSQKFCLVLSG